MSISPYKGHFGRQQGMVDPFFPPQPLSFPIMPSPWDMHRQGFSARNRIEYEKTPNTHLFRMQVQGKEDVRVRVEDGRVLHLSAKGADEREERKEESGYYRMEMRRGEFVSKFKLPEDAKVEKLRSFVKDGTLTVAVPREKFNTITF